MIRFISAFILTALASAAMAVEVNKIELFINSSMKVSNIQFARDIEFDVIYVDQVEVLENAINKQLPANQSQAHEVASKLISDPEFEKQIVAAHKNKLIAWKYGVKHLPAAVINNGQGMIYGSTNVAELLTEAQSR